MVSYALGLSSVVGRRFFRDHFLIVKSERLSLEMSCEIRGLLSSALVSHISLLTWGNLWATSVSQELTDCRLHTSSWGL